MKVSIWDAADATYNDNVLDAYLKEHKREAKLLMNLRKQCEWVFGV